MLFNCFLFGFSFCLQLCGKSCFFHVVFFIFLLFRFRKSLFLPIDLHKFLTGDRLLLDQMCSDLIHNCSVFRQHLFCFLVAVFQDLHHFFIHSRSRHIGTVHSCCLIQILAFCRCQSHQTETLAHTILGYHGSCNVGCPLNIIGSTCCNGVEYDFFCRASAKKPDDHIMQLCFGIQILFFFRNLHHITKRTHGTRNDRDLLYRLCVFLQGCNQCMTHFVVRYDPSFFLAHDAVFLFFSDQYNLDCVKQILLADSLTTVLNCIDGCFVDHIGQIGTDCS